MQLQKQVTITTRHITTTLTQTLSRERCHASHCSLLRGMCSSFDCRLSLAVTRLYWLCASEMVQGL